MADKKLSNGLTEISHHSCHGIRGPEPVLSPRPPTAAPTRTLRPTLTTGITSPLHNSKQSLSRPKKMQVAMTHNPNSLRLGVVRRGWAGCHDPRGGNVCLFLLVFVLYSLLDWMNYWCKNNNRKFRSKYSIFFC